MFNGIFVNENKNSTMYTNPLSSLYVWCQPHTSQPLQQQQQFYLRFSLTHNFPHNFPSNVLLGAHTTKHEKNDSSKHFFAVLKISNFFISSHAARDDDDDVDCEEKKGSKGAEKIHSQIIFLCYASSMCNKNRWKCNKLARRTIRFIVYLSFHQSPSYECKKNPSENIECESWKVDGERIIKHNLEWWGRNTVRALERWMKEEEKIKFTIFFPFDIPQDTASRSDSVKMAFLI